MRLSTAIVKARKLLAERALQEQGEPVQVMYVSPYMRERIPPAADGRPRLLLVPHTDESYAELYPT